MSLYIYGKVNIYLEMEYVICYDYANYGVSHGGTLSLSALSNGDSAFPPGTERPKTYFLNGNECSIMNANAEDPGL